MDINAKIQEIVTKIKDDKEFAAKFTSDPVKALESVVGIDLPDDQINALIQGVKGKISIDKAGDILGSIKKLF